MTEQQAAQIVQELRRMADAVEGIIRFLQQVQAGHITVNTREAKSHN